MYIEPSSMFYLTVNNMESNPRDLVYIKENNKEGIPQIDWYLPFNTHNCQCEHRTDGTDVLHVVNEFAAKLSQFPRIGEQLSELEDKNRSFQVINCNN